MTFSPEQLRAELELHGVDLEALKKNPPTDPAALELHVDLAYPGTDCTTTAGAVAINEKPVTIVTTMPPEEPIYERPTRNFTEFYFPAREKKLPKQTHIEVTNDKGEKEKLSLTDFKKLRRVHFTVRRDTVNYCGHQIDTYAGPKNNCRFCWFAYFNQHAELVKALDEGCAEHGSHIIDATRGTKFRKRFMRFLGELAYMRREQSLRTYDGKLTEANGETILGAEVSSGNEESGSGDIQFKRIPADEAVN